MVLSLNSGLGQQLRRDMKVMSLVVVGVVVSVMVRLMWVRMDVGSQYLSRLDRAGQGNLNNNTYNNGHEEQGRNNAAGNYSNGHEEQRMNDTVRNYLGQLAVGGDDGLCASGSHQYKYWKDFLVTEALARALAKYAHMHGRCTSVAALAKAEDGDERFTQGAATGCQYVVYHEGYEGLGNRLLSLVTAFAYALVTRRTLVLDERKGHLARLLCQPFRNSTTWLLPAHVGKALEERALTLEDAMRRQFHNVTVVHANLRHEQSESDRRFFCIDTQAGLQKVAWLVWDSNQYYVPRLFMIQEFWTTMQPWFSDVSLVFTQLGRVLCAPQNVVWATIERVYATQLVWAKVLVGIQVRRHDMSNNASFLEPVLHRIIACMEEHQMVPPATKVAVLVTSLQSIYWEKMREQWSRISTFEKEDGTKVKFVKVSEEGREQYSYEQAYKALVEIWLLSFSHKLATSSWSTFGYVAQALGGIHPLILNIHDQHPDLDQKQTPCWRGQSVEPCLHRPFHVMQHSSGNASSTTSYCPATPLSSSLVQEEHEAHSLWVARHVAECQDKTGGLQLVS